MLFRSAALLKEFRSVRRIRAATSEELLALPGFGPKLVAEIQRRLAGSAEGLPPFDASTGEILEGN